MRVKSLSELGSALSARAAKAAEADKRTGLPVLYRPKARKRGVLSMEEAKEARIAFLIATGTAFYSEIREEKPREGDPTRIYQGPRFVPPRLKPVAGRGY